MNNPLKYLGYAVVFREVPNEVSLAFSISGCRRHCEGCHSPYLWEDKGAPLLPDLENVIGLYGGLITCVCFMGGDQNAQELNAAIEIAKHHHLKTCLYTGLDSLHDLLSAGVLLENLDYVKVGHYDQNLGGLDSPNTNQRFYLLQNKTPVDITWMFWKTNQERLRT